MNEIEQWEIYKIEYQNAFNQSRHYAQMRRIDMAFVITIQGAILAIIGKDLHNLDLTSFLLTIVSFFAAITGLNSERRLSSKIKGCLNRAKELETEFNMALLTNAWKQRKKTKFLISNMIMFPLLYIVVIFIWIIIWLLNTPIN
jgi:hypothetical protein